MRSGSPIFAEDSVVEMAAITLEEDIVENESGEDQLARTQVKEEELEKLKAIYETEVFEEQELEEENIVNTSEAIVFMSNT